MGPKRAGLADIKYEVHRTTTLGWADDHVATDLLHRSVRIANVLLRRHRWTVLTVAEFFPRSGKLLGLNHDRGVKIEVRLRRPGNRTSFFSFEEVLCTLIHEVTHCEISPHNQRFWLLYHSLVQEAEHICAELAINGAARTPDDRSGTEAFSGLGRPLGGIPRSVGHQLGGAGSADATPEGRRVAVVASILKRHPELGSASGARARQVGAAAGVEETRLSAVAEERYTQAMSHEGEEDELCGLMRVVRVNGGGGIEDGEDEAQATQPKRRRREDVPPAAPVSAVPQGEGAGEGEWRCPHCTFINSALLPYCEMCCSTDPSTPPLVDRTGPDVGPEPQGTLDHPIEL